jgi:O-antigen/teichoic acid export membrane protein
VWFSRIAVLRSLAGRSMELLRPQSLSRLFVGAFAGTIVGAVLTFAFQTTAARHLNAQGFGEFAYALTLMNIGSLIAPLGFQVAILKYVAKYNAAGDSVSSTALLGKARGWCLFAAVAISLLIAGSAWARSHPQAISPVILALAVAIPFSALTKIEAARLRASRRPALSVFLEVPTREGLAFLLMIGLILIGSKQPYHVAVCYTIAVAFSFFATLTRRTDAAQPVAPSSVNDAQWWSVAFSSLLSTAALLALRKMDLVIVGAVVGYTDAGIYAAAARIADVIQMPLVAASVVASPKVAELYAAGKLSELQSLVGKVGLFAFALSLIGAAPVLAAPEYVLHLFGSEFTQGASALRWLIAGQLFNAFTSCAVLLLTMTGFEWRAALITGSVGIATLGANWLLASHEGMLGVAKGTCISLIVWNVLLCVAAFRKTRVLALPLLRVRTANSFHS